MIIITSSILLLPGTPAKWGVLSSRTSSSTSTISPPILSVSSFLTNALSRRQAPAGRSRTGVSVAIFVGISTSFRMKQVPVTLSVPVQNTLVGGVAALFFSVVSLCSQHMAAFLRPLLSDNSRCSIVALLRRKDKIVGGGVAAILSHATAGREGVRPRESRCGALGWGRGAFSWVARVRPGKDHGVPEHGDGGPL